MLCTSGKFSYHWLLHLPPLRLPLILRISKQLLKALIPTDRNLKVNDCMNKWLKKKLVKDILKQPVAISTAARLHQFYPQAYGNYHEQK